MDRRTFLECGIKTTLGMVGYGSARSTPFRQLVAPVPPVHSIIPVVGDGKWIWTEPPAETGYLEPRNFDLDVGIYLEGTGPAQGLKATTPVPVELPEQTINQVDVRSRGGSAELRPVAPAAAQLVLAAPSIVRGQTVSATAKMRLTLFKQYQGFDKDQFPADQPKPPVEFRRQYLYDSPGIQTRAPEVGRLSQHIVGEERHAWDKARAIYEWVWENIKARMGSYTSVVRALRDRVGDCEERAACFVALCRAAGIPARLVWVPNHNWAEFFQVDAQQQGHWIPVHTAAYSWFGWTGAHELVIQKGDSIQVPEKRRSQRLLVDWAQWQGARPKLRFSAELRPVPSEPGGDAGPGGRVKDRRGAWLLQGNHALNEVLRDGQFAGRAYASAGAGEAVK